MVAYLLIEVAASGGETCQDHLKDGALAQLVERFNGIEEVSGSTPLSSTTQSRVVRSSKRQLAVGRTCRGICGTFSK